MKNNKKSLNLYNTQKKCKMYVLWEITVNRIIEHL